MEAKPNFDYVEFQRMQNSMNSKLVSCDGCKKPFKIAGIKFKEDTIPMKEEELHIKYFTCPHCQRIYIVSKENALSLRKKAEYEKECRDYRLKIKKGKQTDKGLQRIIRLRKEYLALSAQLNDKYQGEFNLLNSSVE